MFGFGKKKRQQPAPTRARRGASYSSTAGRDTSSDDITPFIIASTMSDDYSGNSHHSDHSSSYDSGSSHSSYDSGSSSSSYDSGSSGGSDGGGGGGGGD